MKRTLRKNHSQRNMMSAYKQQNVLRNYPDRRSNVRQLARKTSLRQYCLWHIWILFINVRRRSSAIPMIDVTSCHRKVLVEMIAQVCI